MNNELKPCPFCGTGGLKMIDYITVQGVRFWNENCIDPEAIRKKEE